MSHRVAATAGGARFRDLDGDGLMAPHEDSYGAGLDVEEARG